MARRGRKCVVEGCWRRAKGGKLVCIDHQRTGLGKELGREIAKLERGVRAMLMGTGQDASDRAAKRFRRQVERGEFAALFAGRMQELFDEEQRPGALEDEIGALRIALMRLLLEESDPARLAKGISQVTNATVRVLRAQEAIDEPHVTAAMLERSIARLDREGVELSEDEVMKRELREWERAVGWNKTMEKAWYSPENQRRLLEEGKREAVERMNHRWEMRRRHEEAERSEKAERRKGGDEAIGNGQWAIGWPERRDRVAAGLESEIWAVEENEAKGNGYEEAMGNGQKAMGGTAEEIESREEQQAEIPSIGAGEEWPTDRAEGEGGPMYSNELERLFWEDPDPFAYQRELRRQMEKEGY